MSPRSNVYNQATPSSTQSRDSKSAPSTQFRFVSPRGTPRKYAPAYVLAICTVHGFNKRRQFRGLYWLRELLPRLGSKSVHMGAVPSWVDHFLGSKVHMVGFGLDYTENHLWNLISELKSRKKKGRLGLGSLVYHRCSDKSQSTAEEARHSLLEAFGVKVVDHRATSYE